MELLNIDALALMLNIKKPTLRKMTIPGRETIPCYRIGRRIRFDWDEIKAWLKSTKAIIPTEENVYDPKIQKSPIASRHPN